MRSINMHEAKTHLSRLIREAVETGEPFIIARAGEPLVKVEAVGEMKTPHNREKIFGALRGKAVIPDDIDAGFNEEILDMFGLND